MTAPRVHFFVALLGLSAANGVSAAALPDKVDFNRDIRPLLSDRCFQCHGPDDKARKSDLRLDTQANAHGKGKSGEFAIVAGKPDLSEFIHRITTDDPDDQMPPEESNKSAFTADEIALFRRWVEQGAEYDTHWGFVAPVASEVPKTDSEWVKNDIDAFIVQRLDAAGLAPNPPAPKASLLRRVTFDLTGLPPTPEELTAFETDNEPDAYAKAVDRLLASETFGERMAHVWLDASRYGDTNGYLQNPYRNSWPWRDWLVGAFNKNIPYDRFITEMLAGDQVPEADEDTRLATTFLRMHMITSEGGSLDEEFRIEYAADRAETVATVFMGVTLNCCRCHDHKFDPFGQQDYYQMLSMFADPKGEDPVNEHSRDVAVSGPLLRLDKTRYLAESERLDRAAAAAAAEKNGASQQRLMLQKKMLDDGLSVMVMEANPAPPQNYVHLRGAYDAPDEDRPVVQGGVDALLAWDKALPHTRLGFAQWLTSPSHPLTARVEVNRIWEMLFGRGLVASQEDFGMQSSYPSHPELLDTLAVRFWENGWDRKALIRELVTSATYCQSSQVLKAHRKLDPNNALYGRLDRRRLPAEAIRDQALFVSGLLNSERGGHPVLPYQPPGLWREGANNPGHSKGKIIMTGIFEQSSGDELYRRSLYTFWNRNAPPPQMVILDVPSRNYASVSRSPTNTPLQALVTMNDPQFTEAARFLAERTLLDKSLQTDGVKAASIYRRCTGRPIDAEDSKLLLGGLGIWRERFTASPDDAESLLTNSGNKARDPGIPAAEHAAWMMLAGTVLNLEAALVLD